MRFADDIRYQDEYDGLALGTSEGDRICETLGDKRIVFLANHGVIVVGQTIPRAFDDLYYLERECQLQYYVQSAGQKLKVADDRIARQVAEQFADYPGLAIGHLGAIRRILDREEPEYTEWSGRDRHATSTFTLTAQSALSGLSSASARLRTLIGSGHGIEWMQ